MHSTVDISASQLCTRSVYLARTAPLMLIRFPLRPLLSGSLARSVHSEQARAVQKPNSEPTGGQPSRSRVVRSQTRIKPFSTCTRARRSPARRPQAYRGSSIVRLSG